MLKKTIRLLFFYIHSPLLLFFRKNKYDDKLFLNKNYLIITNHSSSLDPVFLTLFFYYKYKVWIRFLATYKIYRNPVVRFYLFLMDAIKVEKNNKKQVIDQTVYLLKKGENICIFPEGTRVLKKKKNIKTGFIRISVKSKIPILPIKIIGTKKMLPRNKYLPRFNRISVIVGGVIYLDGNKAKFYDYSMLKTKSKELIDYIYSLK